MNSLIFAIVFVSFLFVVAIYFYKYFTKDKASPSGPEFVCEYIATPQDCVENSCTNAPDERCNTQTNKCEKNSDTVISKQIYKGAVIKHNGLTYIPGSELPCTGINEQTVCFNGDYEAVDETVTEDLDLRFYDSSEWNMTCDENDFNKDNSNCKSRDCQNPDDFEVVAACNTSNLKNWIELRVNTNTEETTAPTACPTDDLGNWKLRGRCYQPNQADGSSEIKGIDICNKYLTDNKDNIN